MLSCFQKRAEERGLILQNNVRGGGGRSTSNFYRTFLAARTDNGSGQHHGSIESLGAVGRGDVGIPIEPYLNLLGEGKCPKARPDGVRSNVGGVLNAVAFPNGTFNGKTWVEAKGNAYRVNDEDR